MMDVRSFNFSKVGNMPEETEDSVSINLSKNSFSVSDGASDSIFSGLWATELSKNFTSNSYDLRNSKDLASFLDQSRQKWMDGINWSTLKWNVKNKAMRGAYSTFLGVRIVEDSGLFLESYAVGDSCLFIFDENLVDSFPIKNVVDFGIHPQLIWSGYGHPLENKRYDANTKVEYYEKEITKGSKIILATDAMSSHILKEGGNIFDILWENYENYDYFYDLRTVKKLKNDDLAAILISF
jgi:hypothetical protein